MIRFSSLVCLLAFAGLARADAPAPVGGRAPDFTLPDAATGRDAQLAAGTKATVLAFTCTGCPVSANYLPVLARLHKRHADDNVEFVNINCHPSDTAADAAQQAKEIGLPFRTLKDTSGEVARQLNVTRVPTVIVLDAGKHVRYFGRVDDQFAPGGRSRGKPTTHELATAIAAVVEGREVKTPFAEPAGCALSTPVTKADVGVTYHKEVARLIQEKCQVCHRPGEAAPFTLMNYRDAKSWAGMIREVVADNVMPPWHADGPVGHFANDRRLSDAQKKALLDWVDAGCPEGNPADAPPAKVYAEGWRLGREPDVIVKMEKPVSVPAQFLMGVVGMPYQYIKGEADFKEDTWVQGVEVRPDLRAAIHHIIVYTIPKGAKLRDMVKNDGFSRHMLAAFVPGDAPAIYPEGMAKKIPAGAALLFEVHYTPNGKAGVDRSSVGILVAKSPPKYEVKSDAGINHRLDIPPGDADYKIAAKPVVFTKPATIVGLTPHMHLRGKAFRYELVRPDGTREVLLNVPNYDFNWQVAYSPAAPPTVPAGSKIECVAWFDNSKGNLSNPDPTKRVHWGQQTWEEMMIGFVEYYETR